MATTTAKKGSTKAKPAAAAAPVAAPDPAAGPMCRVKLKGNGAVLFDQTVSHGASAAVWRKMAGLIGKAEPGRYLITVDISAE